jgi:hypothetical protein
MIHDMRTILFAMILSSSVHAMDVKPMLLLGIWLSNCAQSYAQNLVADEVLSDRWTYDNTNAQTICGVIGFLGMFSTFFSSWYFYCKGQKKLLVDLKKRKEELESIHIRSEEQQEIDDLNQFIASKCQKRKPLVNRSGDIKINIPDQ